MVRRMLVVLGLAALVLAGVLLLRPVEATVSTSIFPDALRNVGQLRLGGNSGVTLTLDGPSARINCGPALSPSEITVTDPNVLSKIVGGAQRVESRITAACGAAIDRRRVQAAIAGGAALLLFVLAAVARPARSPVAAPVWAGGLGPNASFPPGAVPMHSQPPTAAPMGWPAPGAASAPQPPPASGQHPLSQPLPGLVAPGAPPPARPLARGPWPARARQTAVVGVTMLACVGIAAVWSMRRSGADTNSVSATTPTTVDPRVELERACMRSAIERADAGFQSARTRSADDQQKSNINLDGDDSFRTYAEQLQSIDVASCPVEFRSAFLVYVEAWRAYGDKLRRATKGVLRETFSDSDHAAMTARVNTTRRLLEDIAERANAVVGHSTFSL